MPNDWEVTEAGVIFELTCASCGEPFPATLSHRMATHLQELGITGTEVGEIILAGVLRRSIACKRCLAAAKN